MNGQENEAELVIMSVVMIVLSLLGIMLVEVCLWTAAAKTNSRAKWLMHATVLHLPLLLGLLIYDKFSR